MLLLALVAVLSAASPIVFLNPSHEFPDQYAYSTEAFLQNTNNVVTRQWVDWTNRRVKISWAINGTWSATIVYINGTGYTYNDAQMCVQFDAPWPNNDPPSFYPIKTVPFGDHLAIQYGFKDRASQSVFVDAFSQIPLASQVIGAHETYVSKFLDVELTVHDYEFNRPVTMECIGSLATDSPQLEKILSLSGFNV